MKTVQVRIGTFETNSSSTHSIVICTPEEYEKWRKGELLCNEWDEKLMTPEEVEKVGESKIYYLDLDGWVDELELSVHNHTTKGGEELVIVSKYGYDG